VEPDLWVHTFGEYIWKIGTLDYKVGYSSTAALYRIELYLATFVIVDVLEIGSESVIVAGIAFHIGMVIVASDSRLNLKDNLIQLSFSKSEKG
jgi:hypothetical protein